MKRKKTANEDQTLPVKSQFLLYQTEDGHTNIEVRLQDETVWMTQAAMAELYQTTPQNITTHLKAIYKEGELEASATCKEYLQVQLERSRRVSRTRKFYNLPAIITVGYRVRSHRGTQFRRWATERLNEYVVKGFTMDDDRLKAGINIGSDYFGDMKSFTTIGWPRKPGRKTSAMMRN
ncbi:MAG: RhuM family protein [Pseudomonadota bacterium]